METTHPSSSRPRKALIWVAVIVVATVAITALRFIGHAWLYEDPGANPPIKQSSRWNRLADRAALMHTPATGISTRSNRTGGGVV